MIPQPCQMSWQEAINAFIADRVDLSPTTVKVYTDTLTRFFAATGATVDQVGRLHILRYLQRYAASGAYNNNLSALKSFFDWAADYLNIANPAAALRRKRLTCPRPARVITAAEYQRIAATKGSARGQIVFLANTGLRASEFVGLRPCDIAADHIAVFGKGAKPRTVPLNRTAQEVIRNLNFPKSYNTLRHNCVRMARRCGIPQFGPHALRHYFATTLIDKGAPLAAVSRILGHADIRTTVAYYYHPGDLPDVVALLDG